tara:strand:+ start:1161 stop:1946 length:786 start_codon:yes stop_codon:yes gene_type:complete
MKFSIIINTHNQSSFIGECINSCINQDFQDYEIIITDTSDQKINKKYIKSKKIKYFHIKRSLKDPVMDQMNQVLFGLNKSSGKYICLLDGDDKFSKKKLKQLSYILKDEKIDINQDLPTIFSKNIKIEQTKIKNYKNNDIFKKTIIDWPQIYGTSTITIKKKILKLFFKKTKPFKWKYLAIDAQLILFCSNFFNIKSKLNKITFKRKHEKNLDETFSNLMTKAYWIRRKMQLDLNLSIKKKNTFNLDFFITNFMFFIVRFF